MPVHLSDKERLYYSRQIILPGWNEEIQLLLKDSKVLVIGAGGLSCPLLQYLTRAGIGQIGIVDGDDIQYSNLHRQSLFDMDDIGHSKAQIAAKKLKRVNPHIKIIAYEDYLTINNVDKLFSQYQVVADGTDNFPTRYLINDFAVKWKLTNVFAAVNQFEGQLAVFNYPLDDGRRSGHYRDIFPKVPADQAIPNCTEQGVLGTTTSIIGSLQAAEIIKVILRAKDVYYNQLIHINLNNLEQFRIKYQAKPHSSQAINPDDYNGQACPSKQLKSIEKSYLDLKTTRYQHLKWIDVRSEKEHLLDPLNGRCIPWQANSKPSEYLAYLPAVLYCQTGKRSRRALEAIKKAYPMAEIYSLKGGIENIVLHSQKTKE